MKPLNLYLFVAILTLLAACQQSEPHAQHDPTALAEQAQKAAQADQDQIRAQYEKMIAGFKQMDFSAYYQAMHEEAIVVDANNGTELSGKQIIEAYFDQGLEESTMELNDWGIDEILVSGDLALVKAAYRARFHNDQSDIHSHSNWHMVWHKDQAGDWKIIREVYYEKQE